MNIYNLVLQETITFYCEDNGRRATVDTGDSRCEYVTARGNKRCAIGRLLLGHQALALPSGGIDGITKRTYSGIDDLVSQLNLSFLQELQTLHDVGSSFSCAAHHAELVLRVLFSCPPRQYEIALGLPIETDELNEVLERYI